MIEYRLEKGVDTPTAIEAAFSYLDTHRDASTFSIVLDDEASPDRALVEPVVKALTRRRQLAQLVLVHPNALLGFLVSSIGMQCPWARVEYANAL